MKLFALCLAPFVLQACSSQPTMVSQAQIDSQPTTTVYVSAHAADPATEKPVIESSQPDAGPSAETAHTVRRKPAKHAAGKLKVHAVIRTEHGAFHNNTPD